MEIYIVNETEYELEDNINVINVTVDGKDIYCFQNEADALRFILSECRCVQ